MKLSTSMCFAAVMALGLMAASARAEYKEIDAIAAVVEEDVILASELLERVDVVQKQMAASDMTPPPSDILISQIMERLILESIQLQQAERRGIDIDDETLTRAVMQFATNNNMNLEQFQAALVRDGLSYPAFREEIRREMALTRLQRGIVNRRISVSEQEIKDLLSSPFYQELLSDEFRVGHILLTVDQDADEDVLEAALNKADDIVAELRAGGDFAQAAVANSSASTALEGGDLGWRRAGELPSLFAERVLSMEQGQVADPIVQSGAIHIVKLLEQRGAGVQQVRQRQLRHILVQASEIRTEAETEALIWSLYEKLLNGADFAELAKEHSQDPGSALNGGDLGWSTGDEFVPEFRRQALEGEVGAFTQPFRSQYGWHVLEVLDEREQDMSQEAREDMAMRVLHQRRFNEELEAWLKEIRDEAYVEVRL